MGEFQTLCFLMISFLLSENMSQTFLQKSQLSSSTEAATLPTTGIATTDVVTGQADPIEDTYFSGRELSGDGNLSSWELLKLRLEVLNKLPKVTIIDYVRDHFSDEDRLKILPSDFVTQNTWNVNDFNAKLQKSLKLAFAPLIKEIEERMKSEMSPLAKSTGFDDLYSKIHESFGTYLDNVNRHLAELKQELEAADMEKAFSPLLNQVEHRLANEVSLLAEVVMKVKADLSEIKMNDDNFKTEIRNGFDFMEKFIQSRKHVDGNINSIYENVSKLDCASQNQLVSLNGNLSSGFNEIKDQLLDHQWNESCVDQDNFPDCATQHHVISLNGNLSSRIYEIRNQLSQLIAVKEELWNDQDDPEMVQVPSNPVLQNGTTLCGINEPPGLMEQITTFSLTEDGLAKLCIFMLAFGQLLSWLSKIVRYALISSYKLCYIQQTVA